MKGTWRGKENRPFSARLFSDWLLCCARVLLNSIREEAPMCVRQTFGESCTYHAPAVNYSVCSVYRTLCIENSAGLAGRLAPLEQLQCVIRHILCTLNLFRRIVISPSLTIRHGPSDRKKPLGHAWNGIPGMRQTNHRHWAPVGNASSQRFRSSHSPGNNFIVLQSFPLQSGSDAYFYEQLPALSYRRWTYVPV